MALLTNTNKPQNHVRSRVSATLGMAAYAYALLALVCILCTLGGNPVPFALAGTIPAEEGVRDAAAWEHLTAGVPAASREGVCVLQ